MSIGCRTCGTLNSAGATACRYCGTSLPSTPIYHDPFRVRPVYPSGGAARPQWPVQRQVAPVATSLPKDPSTGLLIELLPGFFGFLGIGYLWAGETALGIGLLIGYWLFWAFVGLGTLLSAGLLLCFVPCFALLYFAAPIISAVLLQKRLRQRQLVAARYQ